MKLTTGTRFTDKETDKVYFIESIEVDVQQDANPAVWLNLVDTTTPGYPKDKMHLTSFDLGYSRGRIEIVEPGQ